MRPYGGGGSHNVLVLNVFYRIAEKVPKPMAYIVKWYVKQKTNTSVYYDYRCLRINRRAGSLLKDLSQIVTVRRNESLLG